MDILFLPAPKEAITVSTRFGQLTVCSYLGRTWNRDADSLYLCNCDCGNTKIARGSSLRKGKTKSCGCLHRETARKQGISNRRKNPQDTAWDAVYKGYIYSAEQRGLVFSLSREQAIALMKANCHYCGAPPSLSESKSGKAQNRVRYADYYKQFQLYRNGIDRIDNTQGYLLTNCISACKFCNLAKATSTYDDFISWAKRVAKHHDQ